MIKKIKKRKGFTIVELIVVIAVLGILILMAAPKFIGYVEKAKISQIKADSKSYESYIGAKRQKDDNYHRSWSLVEPDELREKITELKLYNKRGLVEDTTLISDSLKYYEIPKRTINTKLDGTFIYAEDGTVYYDGPAGKKVVANEDSTYEDYRWIEFREGISPAMGPLSESFLADVSQTREKGNPENGYWHYIGNDDVVVIPDKIQGYPVTSYYRMFADHDDFYYENFPKKIISKNKNIVSMNSMFEGFGVTSSLYREVYDNGKSPFEFSLDLSEVDTSNVKDMSSIFDGLNIWYLDISTWDTSNVTSMYSSFAVSDTRYVKMDKAIEFEEFTNSIDWSGDYTEEEDQKYYRLLDEMFYFDLDTSNVKNMARMFNNAYLFSNYKISLETNNVENMGEMFKNAIVENGTFIEEFDTTNVESFNNMFYGARIEKENGELDLSQWNTSKATDFSYMFSKMYGVIDSSLDDYKLNLDVLNIEGFDFSSTDYSGISNMFDSSKISKIYVNDEETIEFLKNPKYGKPSSSIIFE